MSLLIFLSTCLFFLAARLQKTHFRPTNTSSYGSVVTDHRISFKHTLFMPSGAVCVCVCVRGGASVWASCHGCISISAWSKVGAAAPLSDELHWYNGCFNPSQLDPQGTGSSCFHTAPISAGGGRTDWQAAVWTRRHKIGYNSGTHSVNVEDAACMVNMRLCPQNAFFFI